MISSILYFNRQMQIFTLADASQAPDTNDLPSGARDKNMTSPV